MDRVVSLLRRRGEVLARRTGEGWDTVTAAVDDPDAAAETARAAARDAVDGSVTLVRAGDPVDVDGRRHHPFLFDVDDEATVRGDGVWVSPLALRDRRALWAAYRAVAPTADTVAADRTHGSAWLSVRALEALRDRAAATDDIGAVRAVAVDIRDARPSMAAVATRIDRVMAGVGDDPSPAAVAECADAAVDAALDADGTAARLAAERCGDCVATLSRSGTALTALRAAGPRVVVAESRPGGEGVDVAADLADAGLDVTLTPDAALARALDASPVDTVLVGADAVLADGSVVNKVGTRGLALAAAREGVPVTVVAAAAKIRPDERVHEETGDPDALYDGDAPVDVSVPVFDRTPADLVDAVVTERGTLDADGVGRVAAEHRENAAWVDDGTGEGADDGTDGDAT